MQILDKIIVSPTAPSSKNVAWFDGKSIKIQNKGKWENTSESSSGGGNVGGNQEGTNISKMINITYEELVNLRDNSKLIPGAKYRMIDYETIVSGSDIKSAMHPFDLILTALDEKTLSEECRAIQSARDVDGYYSDINLKSWDVRYCLDNDSKRFTWAVEPGLEIEIEGEKLNLPQVSFLEQLFNDQCQALDIPQDTFGIYMDGSGIEQWMILRSPVADNCIMEMISYNATTEDFQLANDFYLPPKAGIVLATQIVPVTKFNKVVNVGKGVIYRIIDEFSNDISYDWTNIIVNNSYYGLGIVKSEAYQKGRIANNLITSFKQGGSSFIPSVYLSTYSDGYEYYLIGNRIINSTEIYITGQKVTGNIIEGCKSIRITNGYFIDFMFNTLRGIRDLHFDIPQGGTPFNHTTFLSSESYFTTEELYNAITATKTE